MQGSNANDLSWIFDEVKNHSNALSKAIIAITMSNIFQVFSTLFVMAVYNKVIPNESMNTLFSLAVGICVILTFDFLFKVVKSKIADEVCSDIEEKLGPKLYQKILAWDLQNVPKASGQSSTLTKDLDQVIELFTSSTITSCVNVPFILVNLAVIYLIGGSIVIVPLTIALLIFVNCLLSYLRTKSSAEPLKQTSIDKTRSRLAITHILRKNGAKSLPLQKKFHKNCVASPP